MTTRLLAAALCTAAALPSFSAPAAAEDLTLERLFASPDLSGPVPREVKLSPDGRFVTLLKPRAEDRERFDLWSVDTETGKEAMLVDSTALDTGDALSEEERMRRERARIGNLKGIVAYDWAPSGDAVLVPVSGDLFLARLGGQSRAAGDAAGEVRRLTDTPGTELDAQVSADGGYVSYVIDQDLHTIDLASGADRVVADGEGTVSWGVAEFVAQEEMDRDTGHWWAPDDSRLAAARVDEAPVEIVTRTAIGAEGTRVYDQRYPAAGTPNAVVDLFVMDPDGGDRVEVDLGDNDDIYLARVDWAPDASALYVQRQSRDQKTLDMLRVDPETGASEVLFTETAENWLNLHSNLHILEGGDLIWTSERDGFSHIYRWHDGTWQQLTRGPWRVSEIEAVDEAGDRILFTANRDTPLEDQLYSIPPTGGEPARLTEAGYDNEIRMDDAGRRMLVTRSAPTQPPQTYLADEDGTRIVWIEANPLGKGAPYTPYLPSHEVPEFGTLAAADGSALQYKLLSPKRQAGKRYPVFVQVYGGPGAGRQVKRNWASAAPLQQWLVDNGWIVFSIDGRGTPDRGKAFEDQIARAMGTVEVEDQLAGLTWLKAQDFVDPDRIAVNGWSYGGYMTLRLLEAAPGAYAAGVSGAPVTDWTLYDTHYTERYLGDPNADPAVYPAAGALANADRIADPLLLIHGMADDNVVFENSTVLMGALQSAGVPFDLMVYPGATHRVSGEGRDVHLWRTITRFLNREVKNPPTAQP
ncbi:S9 family peptidase [Pacificimonas flava]|uniref:Dipeptidyl peptidase IV n=1 Tax=Pacificimonas flava TaxID=1234595 RepID=M2U577_9SPHN|nr:DPP IV N-terminal domain-containing protein [Pacificimonas flava]EMD83153.1 Dipeptidyl peptidase IV [Pacificimonas flava]MBB5279282.1 dipeptidyl-peptidase-4 [Pacificimonas flava]